MTDPAVLLAFIEGAAFAIVLVPLGYRIFWWGMNKSKREGTLGWF
ncbi:MAG TPA: hypothetical protein VJ574_01145 [Candidatus Bathyarchaeia archaeon]|nr:hypothetical protein [Candidatus Bathyarchaeia archaeon]